MNGGSNAPSNFECLAAQKLVHLTLTKKWWLDGSELSENNE
jgi:hypothetical protein